MARAGADEPTQIDHPSHRLAKGLQQGRRFESVKDDGYDPNGIVAKGNTSLVKHVASRHGYEPTLAIYDHAFWKSLTRRSSTDASGNREIEALLEQHGLARLNSVDQSNAMALGLISDSRFELGYGEEYPEAIPPRLAEVTQQATLDSLHLLLLLYREAQDLADEDLAGRLRRRLCMLAEQFAEDHHYSGEQSDTWKYLLATRMLSWNPGFEPPPRYIKLAEDALYEEYKSTPRKPGKRSRADPKTYTKGRAERRWRRSIWARACRLTLEEQGESEDPVPPDHHYVPAELGQWLIDNRELISLHHDLSITFLMDEDPTTFVEEGIPWNAHPTIAMPESLFKRRRRPVADEQTRFHFGQYLPYDIIPVKKS